jgi:uncharacterized protein YndB with AHSA1/START domain
MDGIDPARVWAFVADPARIDQWAPVRSSSFMGTELPSQGHTVFLHRTRRRSPDDAWRCRIEAWDAGHAIRCALETPGPAESQEMQITVATEGSGDRPIAAVSLEYRGDVPPWLAPVYRWRIRTMLRRAVRRIRDAVGAG